MADRPSSITIELPPEKLAEIKRAAHEAGFLDIGTFFLILFEMNEEAVKAKRSKEDVLQGIKAGIEDAIAGRTRPIDELWPLLNDDE